MKTCPSVRPSVYKYRVSSHLQDFSRLLSLKMQDLFFLWSVFLHNDPIFTSGNTFLFLFTVVVGNKKLLELSQEINYSFRNLSYLTFEIFMEGYKYPCVFTYCGRRFSIFNTKTSSYRGHKNIRNYRTWLDSKTLCRMCQISNTPALPAVPSHIFGGLP